MKLIALTLTGFAAYSTIIEVESPEVSAFQNQWVRNYSVAEKYIYSDEIPKVIIVGSSMSTRLVSEKFSKDVYNLAFGGGSALTGLEIIRQRQHIPDVIFIESNIAEKALDEDMIDSLFIPVLWKIRGHIKSLQYTYQPINILLSIARSKYEKSNPITSVDKPNKKILESSLNKYLEDQKNTKRFSGGDEFIELKNAVEYFKGSGTKIVFFEMPVHSILLSSSNYVERRSILLSRFSDAMFYWVDHSLTDKYITSDGIHLLPHSAGIYSSMLSEIIEKESTVSH